MLEDVYYSYRRLADLVEWKLYNQNDLFFEYIKNENDSFLKECFYSAIVCRYWGYTGRIYVQHNRHIPFEQCYDILIDTINYVLSKRVWENPDNSLYNDPRGPDKAFHMVLKRQRSILLSNLTAYKRKTNFNTLSIDEIHEKYSDAAEGLFEIYSTSESDIELIEFIKNQKDTLSIIILDKICFDEWNSIKKVSKLLKELDETSGEYYYSTYGILPEEYGNVTNKIKSMRESKLTTEIKKLLYLLRREMQ